MDNYWLVNKVEKKWTCKFIPSKIYKECSEEEAYEEGRNFSGTIVYLKDEEGGIYPFFTVEIEANYIKKLGLIGNCGKILYE